MSPGRLARQLALPILLAGCQRMTLEGTVTGPTGTPIADARIAVVGALCHGKSDADGHFSVPCTPGDLTVAVMQEGYVSQSVPVEATEKRAYPLGTIQLLPIPESAGLYVLHGESWEAPVKVFLKRRLDLKANPARRATCLVPTDVQGTPVPQDAVLYARDTGDVEVFRLDSADCARHLQRHGNGWITVDTTRPERRDESVAQGQRVLRLTLPAGRYVVVPWRNGEFTKDPEQSQESGEDRFSAFLLVSGGEDPAVHDH